MNVHLDVVFKLYCECVINCQVITDLAFAFFSPFDLLFDFIFLYIGRVIYYHYVLVLVFIVSFYYFNFVWLYCTRKEKEDSRRLTEEKQ